MSLFNKILRKSINNKNKVRIKNRDFSVIASNCTGTFLLHDLGLKFNTPFINLWLSPKDFIKFCENMDYYLNCELAFTTKENIDYPVGVLKDINIYFQHYKDNKEAYKKWNERKKRINKNNMFIILSERDGCTYEDLLNFDKLEYKNKIVFTHKEYKEIKSSFYLKSFKNNNEVGKVFNFINTFSGKKFYDEFDYVNWFNCSI